MSKHSCSHYVSHIERGANGGLAGSDVRILERTGRTVSVTGIGNHELPGLDIVACAALLHTNHGTVVLIMHEYAYYGRGNTIISPGKNEWFQNICDDKSFNVGGKQVITFFDGYSTPLQCRTGLMYMNLLGAHRPPNQLSLSGLGKMIVNLLPKPMAEYNPDDLIGRTFLLPNNEQGERLRAIIKRKVIETSKLLDDQHENAIDKINFHLYVGQGRSEAIMSYVHILDHLDHQEQQEDLYKFRAITGHHAPLSPQDENYKGSKNIIMVEWETGEITEEPLSLIAADDPVTCAEYAKIHNLLHLDVLKRLKHIAKNQKQLTRAINQYKIRQVRRSFVYKFGFLISKDYKHALQLDEQNGNSKWYDATKLKMDQINEYKVFQAQFDPKSRKVSNAPK